MDVAYRLYPETDIAGMVGDAKRAVAWLKAHAADYGADPDRIVLGGASAGGHVALLAAYTAGHPVLTPADVRDVDTAVRGVLGWYSPVDLAACYVHYEIAALAEMMPDRPDGSAPPSPVLRRLLGANFERLGIQKGGPLAGRLDWIVGGSPQQVPERYALLSPIAHVHAGCPPTLLMQGRDDIIVPPGPAVAMQQRLRRAGVEAALLLLPYADHAFDLLATNWSPAARQALWHAERFLALLAGDREPAGARGRRAGERNWDPRSVARSRRGRGQEWTVLTARVMHNQSPMTGIGWCGMAQPLPRPVTTRKEGAGWTPSKKRYCDANVLYSPICARRRRRRSACSKSSRCCRRDRWIG
ncbi:MAG: alpha/beta hydrolase fold domain-containing protein [Dehalococcoidia bacterium]